MDRNLKIICSGPPHGTIHQVSAQSDVNCWTSYLEIKSLQTKEQMPRDIILYNRFSNGRIKSHNSVKNNFSSIKTPHADLHYVHKKVYLVSKRPTKNCESS